MKKILVFLLMTVCFIACNNNNTDSATAASRDSVSKDSVTNAPPPPPLPYTASYSSSFVPGKASDVATVFENYRAWQANDMKAVRATFGDSVTMEFSNGDTFKGGADSLMKEAVKFRSALAKIDYDIVAWTSNHSVDKNEDWVNVWYKEVDTYKNGKLDSAEYEDDNLLVNGKIVFVSSHIRKLAKKK